MNPQSSQQFFSREALAEVPAAAYRMGAAPNVVPARLASQATAVLVKRQKAPLQGALLATLRRASNPTISQPEIDLSRLVGVDLFESEWFRNPLDALQQLAVLRNQGNRGVWALQQLIDADLPGLKDADHRRQVWEIIRTQVFEGKEIPNYSIESIRQNGYPKGHYLIVDTLSPAARLEVRRRLFGTFPGHKDAPFELEMLNDQPIRICIKDTFIGTEFLPIDAVDAGTGVRTRDDVHRGTIKADTFHKLKNHIVTATLDNKGRLRIGGGRPNVLGKIEEGAHSKYWGQFGPAHRYERVELVVKDGLIIECRFLQSGRVEPLALIWGRKEGRYLSSYYDKLTQEEFNLLNEDNEIHNFRLQSGGYVALGGRQYWMSFGDAFEGKSARLFDIRNSGGRAFITAGEVVDNGQVISSKHLRVLYQLPPNSPLRSFERGELIDVYENAGDPTVLLNGEPLQSYLMTDVALDVDGSFHAGKFDQFFKDKIMSRARVELKVINGKKRFMWLRAREDGSPLRDNHGSPLIVTLRPGYKSHWWSSEILSATWITTLRQWAATRFLGDLADRLDFGNSKAIYALKDLNAWHAKTYWPMANETKEGVDVLAPLRRRQQTFESRLADLRMDYLDIDRPFPEVAVMVRRIERMARQLLGTTERLLRDAPLPWKYSGIPSASVGGAYQRLSDFFIPPTPTATLSFIEQDPLRAA